MSNQTMPIWALQRINAVLAAEYDLGRRPTNEVLARRTGLSKRIVRRCLIHSAMVSADTKLLKPGINTASSR
jgi:hypothetical protein